MAYRPALESDEFFLEVVTHLCNVQIFKRSASPSEEFPHCSTLTRRCSSPWQKQIADCLSKYDLRYDLGGLAIAKVWGLATLGDYTAVCVTFHPGDMVEYTITSIERATVIFGRQEVSEHGVSHISDLPWAVGESHPRDANTDYAEIVSSVLGFNRESLHEVCQKILYAAACAGVLLSTLDKSIVPLSEAAFRWLAHHNEAELSEELSLCQEIQKHHSLDPDVDTGATAKLSISARSKVMLESDQRQSILEQCEICGEGIGWYSFQEARCAAGHCFGMSLSYRRFQ